MKQLFLIFLFFIFLNTTFIFSQQKSLNNNEENKIQSMQIIDIKAKSNKEIERESFLHKKIYTKENIESYSVNSVSELLSFLPEIEVTGHGVNRKQISYQGLQSSYVSIHVNGVPVTQNSKVGFSLDSIDLSNIEKIEISRQSETATPNSTIGTIINIYTKDLDKPNGNYLSAFSKHILNDGYSVGGGYSLFLDKLKFDLQGSFRYDDGVQTNVKKGAHTVTEYSVPEKNIFNGILNLGYSFSATTKVIFSFLYSYESLIADGNVTTEEQLVKDTTYLPNISFQHSINSNLSLKIFLSYKNFSHDTITYSLFQIIEGRKEGTEAKQVFNNLDANINFSLKQSTLINADMNIAYQLETTSDDTLKLDDNKDYSRHNVSFNLQNLFKLTSFAKFLIGGKVNYNTQYAWNFSPYIHLNSALNKIVLLRVGYTSAYRAPTFKDNFYNWVHPAPFNFLISGNQNLKPETGHSFNFDSDFFFDKLFNLKVRGYLHLLSDKISYGDEKPGEGTINGSKYNGIRQAENISESYNLGSSISLDGQTKINFLKLGYSLNYNYNFAQEKEDGKYIDMEAIIPHSIKGNLFFTSIKTKTKLFLVAKYNSDFVIARATEDTPKQVRESLYLYNLKITQNLLDIFDLSIGVENLFDNKNEDYLLYEGRKFYVGLNLKSFKF